MNENCQNADVRRPFHFDLHPTRSVLYNNNKWAKTKKSSSKPIHSSIRNWTLGSNHPDGMKSVQRHPSNHASRRQTNERTKCNNNRPIKLTLTIDWWLSQSAFSQRLPFTLFHSSYFIIAIYFIPGRLRCARQVIRPSAMATLFLLRLPSHPTTPKTRRSFAQQVFFQLEGPVP